MFVCCFEPLVKAFEGQQARPVVVTSETNQQGLDMAMAWLAGVKHDIVCRYEQLPISF